MCGEPGWSQHRADQDIVMIPNGYWLSTMRKQRPTIQSAMSRCSSRRRRLQPFGPSSSVEVFCSVVIRQFIQSVPVWYPSESHPGRSTTGMSIRMVAATRRPEVVNREKIVHLMSRSIRQRSPLSRCLAGVLVAGLPSSVRNSIW